MPSPARASDDTTVFPDGTTVLVSLRREFSFDGGPRYSKIWGPCAGRAGSDLVMSNGKSMFGIPANLIDDFVLHPERPDAPEVFLTENLRGDGLPLHLLFIFMGAHHA